MYWQHPIWRLQQKKEEAKCEFFERGGKKEIDQCHEPFDKNLDFESIYGGPGKKWPKSYMFCSRFSVITLPWHRLFMEQMEDELGEALPHWDWIVDKDVPDLWEEIRAPM